MKKNNHKKVLNWVNTQRKNMGLKALTELPKGVPENVNSCPIANSFNAKDIKAEVTDEVILVQNIPVPKAVHDFVSKLNSDEYDFSELLNKDIENVQTFKLPQYVSDFIRNFDRGKYPELVKE